MASKYRIEQHLSRQRCLEGEGPLQTEWSDSIIDATRRGVRLTEKGLFFAAVYDHATGECVGESADVEV